MLHNEVYQFLKEDYFESDFLFEIEEKTLYREVSLHFHDFLEIEFFLSGSGTHVLNNTKYQLQSGHVHLLTPADFHLYEPDEGQDGRYINVRFGENLLSPDLLQALYEHPAARMACTRDEEFHRLHSELCLLMEENTKKDIGYQTMIKGSLDRICTMILRSFLRQEDTFLEEELSMDPKMRLAISYVQRNFRNRITVAEVAAITHMSANYFSNCFSKVMGMSFSNYVKNLRLQFAMNLLLNSNLNVNEVSYKAGFNTLSNFTGAFKARYGHSPGYYRRTTEGQART